MPCTTFNISSRTISAVSIRLKFSFIFGRRTMIYVQIKGYSIFIDFGMKTEKLKSLDNFIVKLFRNTD